jgi:hypothetical protein
MEIRSLDEGGEAIISMAWRFHINKHPTTVKFLILLDNELGNLVIPMFCEHTKGSTQTTPLDVW